MKARKDELLNGFRGLLATAFKTRHKGHFFVGILQSAHGGRGLAELAGFK